MTTKRAVIFLNGNLSQPSAVQTYLTNSVLIACDGGLRHLEKLGHVPDVIIGDFDSAEHVDKYKTAKLIRFPIDKDATDSELAIQYAIDQGYDDIIVTGFLGDRIDHMIGNTLLLTKPSFAAARIRIIDGDQEMYYVTDQADIDGQIGDTISLLPLQGDTTATSQGLAYRLDDYVLSPTGNQGISNRLTREWAQITITQGAVLVVHQRQVGSHPE